MDVLSSIFKCMDFYDMDITMGLHGYFNTGCLPRTLWFTWNPGWKYPCYVHGAEKSIQLEILEWTSMFHGYSIDLWTSICVFSINV